MTRAALAAMALAVAAPVPVARAATDDALRTQILGSWGMDPTCSDGSLAFAADGTLAFSGPDGKVTETGTWTIADGVLRVVDGKGEPVPDATIVFGNETVTFEGTDRGKPFERTVTRCDP